MIQWLRPILQNLGFQVSDAPNPIYEEIQPTIGIIKTKHITSIVKHIDVFIQYVHDQYVLLKIDHMKFKTTIQPEYIGTKFSTVTLF